MNYRILRATAGGEFDAEIRGAIDDAEGPILWLPPGAWIGAGIESRLRSLIEDLERDHPAWAACGNFGWLPGVRNPVRCLKDETALGLVRTLGPLPVLALGPGALLLNAPRLRVCGAHRSLQNAATLDWIAGICRAGFAAGLLPFVDERLFTLHPGIRFEEQAPQFAQEFLPLFDRALAAERRANPVSLLIACRTQLNRPGLLGRAVQSFAREAERASPLCQAEIRLISDEPSDELEREAGRLQTRFPSVSIRAWHFEVREKRLSRIDLLRETASAADTDFLWCVDDDDFLLEGGLTAVARVLRHGKPQLVVGHSRIFGERWEDMNRGGQPDESKPCSLFPAGRTMWNLGGENKTPICSAVFPVAALRERIRDVAALGEYMEDYFLLLQLLTRGETIVDTIDVELAGISIRESGNTVTQTDRTVWHQSQAEIVGDALSRAEDNNPLLWRLTEELMRVQSMATRLEEERENVLQERQRALEERALVQESVKEILNSRSWRWSRPIRLAGELLNRFKGR